MMADCGLKNKQRNEKNNLVGLTNGTCIAIVGLLFFTESFFDLNFTTHLHAFYAFYSSCNKCHVQPFVHTHFP
jgi:hypothetical protein